MYSAQPPRPQFNKETTIGKMYENLLSAPGTVPYKLGTRAHQAVLEDEQTVIAACKHLIQFRSETPADMWSHIKDKTSFSEIKINWPLMIGIYYYQGNRAGFNQKLGNQRLLSINCSASQLYQDFGIRANTMVPHEMQFVNILSPVLVGSFQALTKLYDFKFYLSRDQWKFFEQKAKQDSRNNGNQTSQHKDCG